MKIAIDQELFASASATVDLPISSWDEIDEWYVKWDTLHYHIKGEEAWREAMLNSGTSDTIDWKRPTRAVAYLCDEDGDADYGEELGVVE
jgi:hypothetical protein